jgi:hypothetical protein
MKKKDALKEYLKKFDWLWENNAPLATQKQKEKQRG